MLRAWPSLAGLERGWVLGLMMRTVLNTEGGAGCCVQGQGWCQALRPRVGSITGNTVSSEHHRVWMALSSCKSMCC